jgi:VanZ family protein
MLKNNKFSIIVALVILYLSLSGSETFDQVPFLNIPHLDKLMHFMMYFFFMSVLIFENRKTIKSTSHLFLLALIPLLYGITMEVLQMSVTENRSAEFLDFVSNTAGIFASVLLWLVIKNVIKESVR